MLEALMSSGMGQGQTYPDSGPGPKTLKNGSTELGYFGEVGAVDLFKLSELRRQLNFWAGTDSSLNPTWIKMFVAGKVIFFPTQTPAVSISWNQLYAAGLVYGTDSNGVVPGSPAVNQLAYVTRDQYNFKVRCFKSQEDDTANHGGTETIGTSALLKAGEWGKVISALVSPRQSGYTGDNWALYPYNLFILPGTGLGISQNTRQFNQAECLGINNLQVGLAPKASGSYAWMPVLELVSAADVVYFPIKEPVAITKGLTLPVITNDPSYEDSLIVYRAFSAGVQMGRAITTGETEYVDPYYRIEVAGIKVASSPGLPLIIDSVTYE